MSYLPVIRLIGGPLHNEMSPVQAPSLVQITVNVDGVGHHVYTRRDFEVAGITFTGFAFHNLNDEQAFALIMKHFCLVTEVTPTPEAPGG